MNRENFSIFRSDPAASGEAHRSSPGRGLLRVVGGSLFFILGVISGFLPCGRTAMFQRPAIATELSQSDSVTVRKFTFQGNTVFSDHDLAVVLSRFLDKPLCPEMLMMARNQLTMHYVDNGYINSGAVIPDQDASEGVVRFKIIEGRITGILILGSRYFRQNYIKRRIEREIGPPFNIRRVQIALQRLQSNPLIRKVAATVRPGLKPGEADLLVQVTEDAPFRTGLFFSNDRPPSVGALHGEWVLNHRNFSGNGDSLRASFGTTRGLRDGALAYQVPLGRRSTLLRIAYSASDSSVIEEPFEDLDIGSRTDTWSITATHPFRWRPNREFNLGITADHKSNETSILGRSFSFSQGVLQGVSKVTAARLETEWTSRTSSSVSALRSRFSFGVDFLNPTGSAVGAPDSSFLAWLGQAQSVRRLNSIGTTVLLKTASQITRDPLLPMEKFSIGGASSVRGFRENTLVRDNGATASLELRIPMITQAPGRKLTFSFMPFMDWGRGWDVNAAIPRPGSLWSAGAGFLWKYGASSYLNIYYGHPLRGGVDMGSDLQDSGIHFEMKLCLTELLGK